MLQIKSPGDRRLITNTILTVAALVALRLVAAVFTPLTFDEAYYWMWSRHLAGGYYDHPPMVAFVIRAGTLIAASAVAKSPPDGYTLFLAPVTTLAIGPAIYKKLPYDTVKDFAPVGLVGSAQFALIANPNIGAPTLPLDEKLGTQGVRFKTAELNWIGRVD